MLPVWMGARDHAFRDAPASLPTSSLQERLGRLYTTEC